MTDYQIVERLKVLEREVRELKMIVRGSGSDYLKKLARKVASGDREALRAHNKLYEERGWTDEGYQ